MIAIEHFWDWFLAHCEEFGDDFSFSPNGQYELLALTKNIVAQAPPCEGWEYYYAKQPRQWTEIKFEFDD